MYPWLVMDSSVRRCQRTPFMNKRMLLKNHGLFLWNEGGCLVLLRASLSQCQVLRFKQTIPIASVSRSGSCHFSKARRKKCANLLRNSVWSSPTELYLPLLFFFIHQPPFVLWNISRWAAALLSGRKVNAWTTMSWNAHWPLSPVNTRGVLLSHRQPPHTSQWRHPAVPVCDACSVGVGQEKRREISILSLNHMKMILPSVVRRQEVDVVLLNIKRVVRSRLRARPLVSLTHDPPCRHPCSHLAQQPWEGVSGWQCLGFILGPSLLFILAHSR